MFEKNYRLQDIQLSKIPEGSRLDAAAFQYNSFVVADQASPLGSPSVAHFTREQPAFAKATAGILRVHS